MPAEVEKGPRTGGDLLLLSHWCMAVRDMEVIPSVQLQVTTSLVFTKTHFFPAGRN